MAYTPNTWQDRTGTGLNKFTDQNGNEYEFTPTPDEITQQGTPFSAAWMNHIEQGIKDNSDDIADVDNKFPVSIANGGTEATTAEEAIRNLQTAFALNVRPNSVNDLIDTGFYRLNNSNVTDLPLNETSYGLLIVNHGTTASNYDTIAQMYITYNTTNMYFRSGRNATSVESIAWSTWKKILTEVLPNDSYGTSLPAAGTPGRIFFLKA